MDDVEVLSNINDDDSPRARRFKLEHLIVSRDVLDGLRTKKRDLQSKLDHVRKRGAKTHWQGKYLSMYIDDLSSIIATMVEKLGRKPYRC